MRSRVAASVLLVCVMGQAIHARAEGPAYPPAQVPPTPMAAAPSASAYCTPQPNGKPVVPDSTDYASRSDHLRQAAEHLQAAGMGSLAEHVRGLAVAPFAPEPHPLADASRVPPVPAARQVLLAIKLVEIDTEKMRQLGFDFSQVSNGRIGGVVGGGDPRNTQPPDVGTVNSFGPNSNVLGFIEALQSNDLARVLSEPKIVTAIGRPAHFRVGGEVPLWALGPDRQPVQRMERYGTSVDCVPHLTANGNLRLELRYEYSEVDRRNTQVVAGKKNPTICRTNIDTAFELKLGDTLVATIHSRVGDGNAERPKKSSMVLLVTPELVDPVPTATAARRLPPK
jgi:hypothetical protein